MPGFGSYSRRVTRLASGLTAGLLTLAAAGVRGPEDASGLWAKAPRGVIAGPVPPASLAASLRGGRKAGGSSGLIPSPAVAASLGSGPEAASH